MDVAWVRYQFSAVSPSAVSPSVVSPSVVSPSAAYSSASTYFTSMAS